MTPRPSQLRPTGPGPSSPARSVLRTLVLPAVHAGDATLDETSLAVSRHFQDVIINLNGLHLTAADPLTPEPKTSSPPSTSQQGTKRALKGTKTVQLRSVAVVPGLLTASVPLVGPLRGVTAEGPFCR